MEISSGGGSIESGLSNFAPHEFIFDGVVCASMEGLLQSFKFKEVHIQVQVCKLVGLAAKMRGSQKNWTQNQTLYWNGIAYKRKSKEYQELLDRAYDALAQNKSFRKKLLASGDAVFTHSKGRRKESETVLTRREFCSRLTKLREKIRREEMGIK